MMSGYDFLKSQVLRRWQNADSDWDVVMSSGRVFQTQGPATGKSRLPTVESLIGGTSRRLSLSQTLLHELTSNLSCCMLSAYSCLNVADDNATATTINTIHHPSQISSSISCILSYWLSANKTDCWLFSQNAILKTQSMRTHNTFSQQLLICDNITSKYSKTVRDCSIVSHSITLRWLCMMLQYHSSRAEWQNIVSTVFWQNVLTTKFDTYIITK